MSQGDSDLLEKIQVVAPTKKMPIYKSILDKGIIQGRGGKSISPISKASEKRRSVLGEPNMDLGLNPSGKRVGPVILPSTGLCLRNPQ